MFNGFTYDEIKSLLEVKGFNFSYGEEIKYHTVKKIDYVSKYVDEWLYVVSNVSDNIYFIDAMSNAGIYFNNHLSTAICVLNMFVKHAQYNDNRTKKFYLMCNDHDNKKVETMKKIFSIYEDEFKRNNIDNIQFEVTQDDASRYIRNLSNNHFLKYEQGIIKSIILYVDPYNFITDELARATLEFSSKIYCEIILNFFCNDYIRNVNNLKVKEKNDEIRSTLVNFCKIDEPSPDVKFVLEKFIERFKKETKLKYKYSVRMKNAKNGPLYDLVFLTPSIKGLEKIKDATWKIFSFHDECSETINDNMFPNLFGETDGDIAFNNAREKLCILLEKTNKVEFTYEDLETIVLQNSFLKKGHLIEKFIKPLIEKGIFKKKGLVKSFNYTKDHYIFERK